MKKALALTAALVAGSFYLSCEKDDICAEGTPTTPGIVVEFYNSDNQSILKNVTNLQVIAVGSDQPLPLNEAGAVVLTTSKIILPLRTDGDVTQYRLINQSQDPALDNTDIISFNYARMETYVSRACGYKTTFALDPTPATGAVVDDGGDGSRWIPENNVVIVNPGIENENETHIKIYF